MHEESEAQVVDRGFNFLFYRYSNMYFVIF